MGKIRLNDNTELELISIDSGMQEEQECLSFYLKDTKSVEEYDSMFSDKEKTKKISVIGDDGEVLRVHNDFIRLKECGKVYDIVIDANTENPAIGNAVFVMLYRQSDFEKRLEEVEEKVDGMGGGFAPELQAAVMLVVQLSAQALLDAQALEAKAIYPAWDGNGVKYAKDHKVLYKDVLYKCLTEHTSQADWAPDAAPSLWAKVLIPDPEVIPDWEQPESTNGYKKGDRVKHNGKTWESLVENNVWEPGAVGTESLWKVVA